MNSLKRFNEVAVDILRDIIHKYPSDTELRFYKTSIKTILLVNKNLIRNLLENHLITYKKSILERNEEFFLTSNFEEMNRNPDGPFIKFFKKLRIMWATLPPGSKNIIWLHFQILLLLIEQMRESA